MWLFTQYGFFSVVCGLDLSHGTGTPDPEMLMVRARVRTHLEALQQRCPQLAATQIVDSAGTDYRFRIVVPKQVWVDVARDLAAEIDYNNFKNRAHVSAHDERYVDALHDVWGVMLRLQTPATRKGRP